MTRSLDAENSKHRQTIANRVRAFLFLMHACHGRSHCACLGRSDLLPTHAMQAINLFPTAFLYNSSSIFPTSLPLSTALTLSEPHYSYPSSSPSVNLSIINSPEVLYARHVATRQSTSLLSVQRSDHPNRLACCRQTGQILLWYASIHCACACDTAAVLDHLYREVCCR